MVKGTSRRVIVVDSPDPELFEQAIFIIRKDAPGRTGVTQEQLVREARRIVQGYCRAHGRGRRLPSLRRPFLYGAVGFGGIVLGWLLSILLKL